jgi:thioredoxin reductase (NADPH)
MPTFTKSKYELVVIGAGPSGLAAALYAAREGLSTLVLDRGVVGGLAAITATIDNYPGFEHGVGGLELADHLYEHATRFGTEVQTGVEVKSLEQSAGHITLRTSAGSITADAVLVATGSTYRHLDVPGEHEMIGRGVHFCATCDAPLYRGKDILVIGGGNSATQESLFIAKFAKHVTLLVRGPELRGTEIIREQLQALPNVSFRFNTEVRHIRNNGTKVTGAQVFDRTKGEEFALRTDGVFVFVGLNANTQAFDGTLDLDESKFVVTKPDYSTNVPGVFASGDVRSGSTWQIASAIGEGVSAALSVRAYLDTKNHNEHRAAAAARAHAKAASIRTSKS